MKIRKFNSIIGLTNLPRAFSCSMFYVCLGLSPAAGTTPRSSFPNSPATEEPSAVPGSLEPSSSQAAAGGSTAAALKGAAGSIFSRLKDTTKSVVQSVQQSMTSRDLGKCLYSLLFCFVSMFNNSICFVLRIMATLQMF